MVCPVANPGLHNIAEPRLTESGNESTQAALPCSLVLALLPARPLLSAKQIH